jgi:hypothetical protein
MLRCRIHCPPPMSAQKLQVTRSQFNHHLQIKRDGSRLSASRLWTNRLLVTMPLQISGKSAVLSFSIVLD